jgi:hypothetical protein
LSEQKNGGSRSKIGEGPLSTEIYNRKLDAEDVSGAFSPNTISSEKKVIVQTNPSSAMISLPLLITASIAFLSQ